MFHNHAGRCTVILFHTFQCGISITDIDSSSLSSVVVTIDGYIAAQDVLDYLTAGTSVVASTSVTGSTWELTLTGGADINEYETVLDSLTYENSSDNPSTSVRSITVEAYDQSYANLFGADADAFNPDRELPSRNPLWALSFGAGPHICPGRKVAGGLHQTGGELTDDHLYGLVAMMIQTVMRHDPRRHPSKPQAKDDRTERFTRWREYWVEFEN